MALMGLKQRVEFTITRAEDGKFGWECDMEPATGRPRLRHWLHVLHLDHRHRRRVAITGSR